MKTRNNVKIESVRNDIKVATNRALGDIDKVKVITSGKLDEVKETGFKAFDLIHNILHENEMEPFMLSPVRDTYRRNLQLAENVVRQIAESHKVTMEMSAEFTRNFLKILDNDDLTGAQEQLVELVKDHLQRFSGYSTESMMKLLKTYHDFLKFSIKFNRNFSNVVLTEMINLVKIQNKNTGIFLSGNMLADWWNK